MSSDKEFLNWIYERMVCVHGEKDMYDYMINFKSVIDRQTELASLKKQLLDAKQENEQLLKAIESLSPTVKK